MRRSARVACGVIVAAAVMAVRSAGAQAPAEELLKPYSELSARPMWAAKNVPELLKVLKSISDRPIKSVLASHYHGDHNGGIGEMIKLGATVVVNDSLPPGAEAAHGEVSCITAARTRTGCCPCSGAVLVSGH